MCYELIENIAVMVSDIEMGTVGGEPKQGAGPRRNSSNRSNRSNSRASNLPAAPRPAAASMNCATSGAADHVAVLVALQGADAKQPSARQDHHDARPGGPVQEREEPAGDRHQRLERDAARCLPAGRRGFGRQCRGPDAERLRRLAAQETGTAEEHNVPLVFVGASMNDRSSYNAALRAGTLGWPAYWYRGGIEAWVANGLPMVKVKSAQDK